MSKKDDFIFSKDFDKEIEHVGQEDYSKIQNNLKKLAKKSLEVLNEDSKENIMLA